MSISADAAPVATDLADDVPEQVAAAAPGMRSRVAELSVVKEEAARGPSPRATQAQHSKGKLTVRERLELLFDPGTFREVEQLRRHRASGFGLEDRRPSTDGVVTGWGEVMGRTVFAYAHDFRIFGGLTRRRSTR